MRRNLLGRKDNPQKSQDSSEDLQKKVVRKISPLSKLIYIVCFSIIGLIGINFISCNFMIPGSITSANVNGLLKNPPPLECKESERRGYETMITILTTVIALRTKMDDD